MKLFSDKRKRRIFIWVTSCLLVLALLAGACVLYVSDYMHADTEAIEAFMSDSSVSQAEPMEGVMTFGDGSEKYGFIFYPGGKVEYTSYIPLMSALGEKGVFCILLEMPCNLAVLDVNAAEGLQEMYPEIEEWYIGGHSLGGSMAASYLSSHPNDLEGLVLLAAYSTADISGGDHRVLSVYGSEDRVMNGERYEEYRTNLPSSLEEIVISGGCHSYFGMYGLQKGDGEPSVSNTEQIENTAELIWKMIAKGSANAQDN